MGLLTLRRLRRMIRHTDVVVACGSTTLPASVIAGVGTRTPLIYQNIGDPLFWAGRGLRHIRVKAFLRRASAVAALSPRSAAVLRSNFGVPESRLTVIPNARSAADFRPASPSDRAAARHRLGLVAHSKVVAIIGALSAEKRVDVAVEAIARMPDNVQLVVAGDGYLRPRLMELAEAAAPGRVSFLGQLENLTALFHAADAIVLSSDSEGVPGVLIEAGLCGVPAVATDVGYVRDVVVPGITGEVVPPGDPTAVAAALMRVLASSDGLGRRAREHCAENFDSERVMDQWAELVRDVLARRRR